MLAEKIAQLNSKFVSLNRQNQNYILAILQTLEFAQNQRKSSGTKPKQRIGAEKTT